jgi:tRNA threonylcarbamoyladenosine biosynthesis protein TsaE
MGVLAEPAGSLTKKFSMSTYITHSAEETKHIARNFAKTLVGGDIVLLEGNLGAGKTTFVQGILETLGAEKPYTSPTFVICKSYDLQKAISNKRQETNKSEPSCINPNLSLVTCHLSLVHHIDTYRIESKDLLNLGWEEMIQEKNSIILLEWPERVRDILPAHAKTIFFSHQKGDAREIILPE